MTSSVTGSRGADVRRYTTLTLRAPAPYAKRIQQIALSLDLSVAGLLRVGVESLAKDHPNLPPALVADLLRLGSQIDTRPIRLYEAFDPASEIDAVSAPVSGEG